MIAQFLYTKKIADENTKIKESLKINNVLIEMAKNLDPSRVRIFLDHFLTEDNPLYENITKKYFSGILLTNYFLKTEKIVFIDINSSFKEVFDFLSRHIVEQSRRNRKEIEDLLIFSSEYRKAKPTQATTTENNKTKPEAISVLPEKEIFYTREEKLKLFIEGIKYLELLKLPKTALLYKLFNSDKYTPEPNLMKQKYRSLLMEFHPDKNRNNPFASTGTQDINNYWKAIQ